MDSQEFANRLKEAYSTISLADLILHPGDISVSYETQKEAYRADLQRRRETLHGPPQQELSHTRGILHHLLQGKETIPVGQIQFPGEATEHQQEEILHAIAYTIACVLAQKVCEEHHLPNAPARFPSVIREESARIQGDLTSLLLGTK